MTFPELCIYRHISPCLLCFGTAAGDAFDAVDGDASEANDTGAGR